MSDEQVRPDTKKSIVVPLMEDAGDINSRKAVISLFNKISEAVENAIEWKSLTSDAFAATEVIAYAVELGVLDWRKVKAIVDMKFAYDVAYSLFSERQQIYDVECDDLVYEPRKKCYEYCCKYEKAKEFIEFIDVLVEATNSKKGKCSFVPNDKLKGKAASYWAKYEYYHEPPIPTIKHVSASYEIALLSEKDFVDEIRKITAEVDEKLRCITWEYDFIHNSLNTEDKSFGKVGIPNKNEPWGTLYRKLRDFCVKWCLEKVYVGYSTKKIDHIDYTAMRVLVKPDEENIGIRVFIPRYYRFSHLDNYADKDFEPLKKGMDEIYESFQMPRKRKDSKAELEATVKRVRQECIGKGVSRHDAWETARKSVGWSPERMTKIMGRQPVDKSCSAKPRLRKAYRFNPFGDAPDVFRTL